MFDYKGKVVAITGASSGLGKQMAESFAKCGADLVLMARRVERLEASAKEWSEKYGVRVLVGNVDLPTIAYHSSKGAVVNFTKGAAAELATTGITVNCICPGYFKTELTEENLSQDYFRDFADRVIPMKRYGEPGELDAAAIFFGSEEASYVTGQVIAVDGGYVAI